MENTINQSVIYTPHKLERQNATIIHENENVNRYNMESDYLNNVSIYDVNDKELNEEFKNEIIGKMSIPKIHDIELVKKDVEAVVKGVIEKQKQKQKKAFFRRGMQTLKKLRRYVRKNKTNKHALNTGNISAPTSDNIRWVYCERPCVKVLFPLIKAELNSTAFMLRLLTNSVKDTTEEKKFPLKFLYDNQNEELTGTWRNKDDSGDHRFFKLKTLDTENSVSRLIMGLGPSASGKTFWAENVIKIMGKALEDKGNQFPRSFLSVDGGIIREQSRVYQAIIDVLKRNDEISGFKNLVSSGIDAFHKSLFKSGYVKKNIKMYLETQKKEQSSLPVSIYVPETLGDPTHDGYKKSIKPYIELTGDRNWIGLYIWQGRTRDDDREWVKKMKVKYPELLRNENIGDRSTTESGEERQEEEGKEYSSAAYDYSKKHGYKALLHAPGARINIHNSGGEKTDGVFNKSVIIEYPNKDGDTILSDSKELLETDYNSIYIEESVDVLNKQLRRFWWKQNGGKRKTRRTIYKKKHHITKKN